MKYTFTPKEKFAKLCATNRRISTKSAVKLCSVIRKKTLTRAKRLLNDLSLEKRSLDGKHYTKTAKEILSLLEGCQKNAEFLGLDTGRLMVHASAHKGQRFRRRRRKAAYGSLLKATNVEIMLIERGKEKKRKKSEKKEATRKKEAEKIKEFKQKSKNLEKKVEELQKKAGKEDTKIKKPDKPTKERETSIKDEKISDAEKNKGDNR